MRPDKLFRYEALNQEDGPRLYLRDYDVIAETPCGYWVADYCKWPKQKRWVSKTSRKRFAHPTVQEAGAAYYHRKASFVDHCERRLERARREAALIDKEGVPLDPPPMDWNFTFRLV